jgi:hypothetical protein
MNTKLICMIFASSAVGLEACMRFKASERVGDVKELNRLQVLDWSMARHARHNLSCEPDARGVWVYVGFGPNTSSAVSEYAGDHHTAFGDCAAYRTYPC